MQAVISLLYLRSVSSMLCVEGQIWSASGIIRRFCLLDWIKFRGWQVLQPYTSVPALGRWMLPCLTCSQSLLTQIELSEWDDPKRLRLKYSSPHSLKCKGQINVVFDPCPTPCFVTRATLFGWGCGVNRCIYKHLVNDYSGCHWGLKCLDIGMLNVGQRFLPL